MVTSKRLSARQQLLSSYSVEANLANELDTVLEFFGVQPEDETMAKKCWDKYRTLFSKYDMTPDTPFSKTKLILQLASRIHKDFMNFQKPLRDRGSPEKWSISDLAWLYFDIEARRKYKDQKIKDAIRDHIKDQDYARQLGTSNFPEVKTRVSNKKTPLDAQVDGLYEQYKEAQTS
jgi:hypothetical protein